MWVRKLNKTFFKKNIKEQHGDSRWTVRRLLVEKKHRRKLPCAHKRETEEREFGMMSRFQSFFPSEKKGEKRLTRTFSELIFFWPKIFSFLCIGPIWRGRKRGDFPHARAQCVNICAILAKRLCACIFLLKKLWGMEAKNPKKTHCVRK